MAGFDEWATIQKYHINAGKGIRFILDRDLMYRSNGGSVYVVKAGEISDLGSIPRWLWSVLPPHEYPSAYILHDYFCKADWISRLDGDKLLYEALQHSNAPNWKAFITYRGVRLYAIVNRIKS